MFGSIGVALGAASTIASLFETAASISKSHTANQPPTIDQTFSQSTTAAAQSGAMPKDPGTFNPKFDYQTQSALLALQEQHRGA